MSDLFPDIQEQETLEEENLTTGQEPIDEPPMQPGDEEDNYDFKTGNLDDFMHSFQENKEDMPIDEMPTPEEFAETGKVNIPPATARKSGQFITEMIDFSASLGLSLLSGEPRETHKAPDENKKELAKIITEYMKENGGEIPLSVQLIICIVVTYGMQIPGAYLKFKARHGKDS